MTMVKVEWDLESDGEVLTPEQAGIPTLVDIPADVAQDDWADWLSDEYGWCVLSIEEAD